MRDIEKPLFEGLESRLMLSTWVITGLNTGTVDGNPFNQSNINGTAGDDTIVFDGPAAALTGQIDGLGGRDTLIYAPTADGVYVTDGDGTAAYGSNVTVDLQNGQATGTGGISRIEEVTGDTGTGITNTLIGANTANQWHVTGADAGDIGGTGGFVFAHFANLTGGNGDDTFVFSDGMVVSGALAGGGGVDAVDFSAYTTALYWNVTASNAGDIDDNADPLDGVLFGFDGVEHLYGGSAADTFILTAGAEITGALDGGEGDDTLDASAMVADLIWDITTDDGGAMAAGASTTGFSSVENIIGGAGRDEYLFHTGTSLSGTADGGGGVTDTLDYSGVSASQPIALDLQAYAATGLNGGLAGGWSNIESAIGGGAEDVLTGPDTANTWDIAAYNVGTLNSTAFIFEGFEQLVGGTEADQFVFQDAARLSSGVNGAGGVDTIDMTAYRSNNNWRLTGGDAGWVQVSEGFMTFGAVENLTGGDGADSFVFDAAGSLSGNLVGDGSGNGGSDGADSLDLSRFGSPLTWNLSGVNTGAAADGGTFGLNFSEIGHLVSGDGDDAFLPGDGCGVNGSIDAGGGDDTLDMSAWTANLTWAVTGDNSGTVTDTLSFDFKAVENLIGGAGDDDVVFSAGRTVSGTIAGSGGHDTLDYSAYTTAVTFDRQARSATGVFGGAANGFTGIEGVTGGSAVDTLVGLDAGGTWHVTGADNAGLIDGSFTFGSMENLTGGPGDDLFVIDDGLVLGGTVDAGDGNDTLSLDADASLGGGVGQTYTTGSTWDITADYTGDVSLGGVTVPFVSVENLRGGAGNDSFGFADKQVVDVIRGGAGVNSMDITAFTVQVYITFAEGTTVDGTARIYYGVGDEHLMDFYSIQDIQKSTTTIIGSNYVDLTGSLAVDPIFERMSPNEQGDVTVTVTNEGNNAIDEDIDITIYASVDQVVQPGDIILKQLAGQAISLEAGQSRDITTTITLSGDVPAGTYHILAVIDSGDVVEETSEDNNLCIGDRQLNVVWEFGRVSGRAGVVLDVQDPNGTTVTFAMKGDGQGTIVGGNDFTEIILTGTSENSRLIVRSDRNEPVVSLNDITCLGPLNTILARTARLEGTFSVDGTLGRLHMAGADNAVLDVQGTVDPVRLIRFDEVTDTAMNFSSGVNRILVAEWVDTDGTPDTLVVPWIGTLMTRGRRNIPRTPADEFLAGDLDVDITFTGEFRGYTLRNARVKGDLCGVWDLTTPGAGDIGAVTTIGRIADFVIDAPASGIRRIRTDQWADNGGTADGVTASWIGALLTTGQRDNPRTTDDESLPGDLDVSITLSGEFRGYALRNARVKGDLSGVWDLTTPGAGDIGAVTTIGRIADFVIDAPASGIRRIRTDQWTDNGGTADGVTASWIGALLTTGQRDNPRTADDESLPGDLDADITLAGDNRGYSLRNARVKGDIGGPGNGRLWKMAGAMASLTVGGTVHDSRIQVAGEIRRLTAGAVSGSDFLAGVAFGFAGGVADLTAGDFTDPENDMGSVTIRGWRYDGAAPVFLENSNFAAPGLGRVRLTNYATVDTYDLFVLETEEDIGSILYRDTENRDNNWSWRPGLVKPAELVGRIHVI